MGDLIYRKLTILDHSTGACFLNCRCTVRRCSTAWDQLCTDSASSVRRLGEGHAGQHLRARRNSTGPHNLHAPDVLRALGRRYAAV